MYTQINVSIGKKAIRLRILHTKRFPNRPPFPKYNDISYKTQNLRVMLRGMLHRKDINECCNIKFVSMAIVCELREQTSK